MSVKPGFMNSVSFKIIIIAFLALAMLVPQSMISSLIAERAGRKAEVISEISDKWGGCQTMSGPVLTVPYKKAYEESDGEVKYRVEVMNFLPERLAVKGRINPEIRYRSIYRAVVYNSILEIEGEFAAPDFAGSGVMPENIIWSGASVSLGISDMKGIKENIATRIGNVETVMNPGVISTDVLDSGVSSRIGINGSEKSVPFTFRLNLNGSQSLNFIPVGKTTTVSLESEWSDPCFTGAFLPDKKVSEKGFSAEWKVFHLNRNYPQKWSGEHYKIINSAFGVNLLITADVYQQAERTAKYALMFIVMTFSVFFFAEILMARRVHPVQYLMIGFAITVFYILLTALSEHIGFNVSYAVSSMAVIFLITGYSKAIMGGRVFTWTVFSALSLLYGCLYVILQLEDYSLIMGSIGLFAVLCVSMYLTRNIDWYALSPGNPGKDHEQGQDVF